MMVVRSIAVDDVVVGSTILNTRNVLFEIPVQAPVKVKYISDDGPFSEMDTYKDSRKLCKKYANLYSTLIKLSPDIDTGQKVIMHVPSDPSVMRQEDETLRVVDLITDISLTEKLMDYLLDSGPMSNDDQVVIPKSSTLEDLKEFTSIQNQTQV